MTVSKTSISRIGCESQPMRISLADSGLPAGPPLLVVFLSAVALLVGCGRDPKADATTELSASFEGSPAKEDVIQANAAFDEGRYKDSLHLLHKVVNRGDLTERQKKAMAGIVGQVLQAVHDDPQLRADPQLHHLMELLILRTMGEP